METCSFLPQVWFWIHLQHDLVTWSASFDYKSCIVLSFEHGWRLSTQSWRLIMGLTVLGVSLSSISVKFNTRHNSLFCRIKHLHFSKIKTKCTAKYYHQLKISFPNKGSKNTQFVLSIIEISNDLLQKYKCKLTSGSGFGQNMRY